VSLYVSVCVLGTWVSCAKTAEPIEMSFGVLTHVRPQNHVLDVDQDWMNPFGATRGDKSVMQPFVKLLWTLSTAESSINNYTTQNTSCSTHICRILAAMHSRENESMETMLRTNDTTNNDISYWTATALWLETFVQVGNIKWATKLKISVSHRHTSRKEQKKLIFNIVKISTLTMIILIYFN